MHLRYLGFSTVHSGWLLTLPEELTRSQGASTIFWHAVLQSCRNHPQWESLSLQLDVMLDVKDAFLAQDALVVIVSLVAQPLTRHAEGLMTERDTLIVQLVITFLRNLIVIPDSASRSGTGRPVLHRC